MPFVRVELNRDVDTNTQKTLVSEITDIIYEVKPEVLKEGISVAISRAETLGFGGDSEAPAAVIFVTNARMPHSVTLPITQRVTAAVNNHCGISPDRMYLFFHEFAEQHLVGIRGMTFVELTEMMKKAAAQESSQEGAA